jgi:N-acetylglutamate synthase-like GNAT family acetyltransferase
MSDLITLRPIQSTDKDFLFRLYASTREIELAQVNWDATQKEAYLRAHFKSQITYYAQNCCPADFHIILLNDEPIGRLYVKHRQDEIRVADIALLLGYRHRGITLLLLQNILADAQDLCLPVRVLVEHHSSAARVYARLNFRRMGNDGLLDEMEWQPKRYKKSNY